MKHNKLVVLLCLVLTVLLAAAALTGCAKKANDNKAGGTEAPAAPVSTAAPTAAPSTVSANKVPLSTTEAAPAPSELGAGKLSFTFEVQKSDGETSSFAIHTDAETVGDALTELKLVEGEVGQYGLYVTTVLGETLDYNADGMYWAFYENGEYAMTGVDQTNITDGATYAMVATKG